MSNDSPAPASTEAGHPFVQRTQDPALLVAKPEAAAAEAARICESMRGRDGFIFYLGHGVPPKADLEAIQAVTETVQNFE